MKRYGIPEFADQKELGDFLKNPDIVGTSLTVLTPAGPMELCRVLNPDGTGHEFRVVTLLDKPELHRWVYGDGPPVYRKRIADQAWNLSIYAAE